MSWAGRSWELHARRALAELARDPARRAAAARLLGPRLPDTARGDGISAPFERALRAGRLGLRARADAITPLPLDRTGAGDGDSHGTEIAVHWIEIELVDMAGKPVRSERYEIRTPDGVRITGRLDADGRARVDHIKNAGQCQVMFPDLDREAWESA